MQLYVIVLRTISFYIKFFYGLIKCGSTTAHHKSVNHIVTLKEHRIIESVKPPCGQCDNIKQFF